MGARHEHGLHTRIEIEDALATRFTADRVKKRPYYFPWLGISEADEEAAIQSGRIHAGAMHYLGRPRG
jgi:hypothetical protein